MEVEDEEKMETPICPTCGCSLVRLGVTKDQAVAHRHEGEEYLFCCQGCLDLFVTDPKKHLEETNGLIVCPSCLAEKPPQWAAKRSHAGKDVYFCRCPYCAEVFEKNPDYYIGRLEGTVPNQGVLDHEGCCVRPE